MSNVEVTVSKIPFPRFILRGDWGGVVYAIQTEGVDKEGHLEEVEKAKRSIISMFDDSSHYTVTLREERCEFVYENAFGSMLSLVQFRVRDAY